MLFESREDFFSGDRLDATRVYVVDTSADLFLPFLTEIETIQTRGDGFDQVSTLARRELQRRLEDSVRFGH